MWYYHNSVNTCYKCEDRYPGCHAKCERYLEAKAERDKKVEEIKKQYNANRDTDEYLYASVGKSIKRRRKK